jgi:hypothetical protein
MALSGVFGWNKGHEEGELRDNELATRQKRHEVGTNIQHRLREKKRTLKLSPSIRTGVNGSTVHALMDVVKV